MTPLSSLLVFLLFVGSGAAALIYEIVWQQLLQLVVGSSTVSLGLLLATYMGGLCLGSLLAPLVIGQDRHPLRVYAALELAIGAFGLLLLVAMPAVTDVYAAWGGLGPAGLVLRGAIAAACLLPPTALMGATLPAIARWVERSPSGMSRLGVFYTGNLIGAVAGTLGAGFYLLRVFDMNVATYVAVVINVAVAAAAWGLSQAAGFGQRASGPAQAPAPSPESRALASNLQPPTSVYWTIALSGFCALSAEVIWTRYLSLMFGATVYTFSVILAVFLIGLGLGSAAGSVVVRRVRSAESALGWCQIASIAAIAWSAWALSSWLPFWPLDKAAAGGIWGVYRLDFFRTVLAILPAPLLWGASFPLALSAAVPRDADPARLVGRLYAANTIGAIAGALVTSLVLIGVIGSQRTQQVMLVAALVSGLVMLHRQRRSTVAALAVTVVAAAAVPPLPPVLVGYGRNAAAWAGHTGEMLYVGEGRHASIAVSRVADGVLNYHNAGKIQASSQPPDMRLQRMLGHLTTIVPTRAASVLVIGCGAGVTAGAVSVSPMVERVTIVDIEPLVPRAARQYFGTVNHDVLKNPKVDVITDDARHFLATTDETFDAITSDPLDPWVKGAATLYTREFFETARRRLNPGGVMTLFVQLYESSPEAVKSEVATFFEVFPHGMIFGNTYDGQAIDMVLVGTLEEPSIYLDYIDETLRQPPFEAVVRSLGEIGLVGATDLFGNYAGRAADLKPWLADAQINRDRNLRLQYLAGLGVNLHEGNTIYADLLKYRTLPEDLFLASDSTMWRLKQAMSGVRE